MRRAMIRYKVKPDQAATNADLVRAVYDELHSTRLRAEWVRPKLGLTSAARVA